MRHLVILLFLGIVIFFAGNNVLPLTNPDEVFYAGTAKEMAVQGTWSTPYIFDQPQFEKPILTYDLIRAGYLMFGQTPFAARFFPALFAWMGMLAVYFLGRLVYADERKAFMGAFVLMTSALYIGLAKTVFTDMIFSVFILLSLAAFYAGYHDRTRKSASLVLFHIFAALAVLTKGPLGYAIPLAIVLIFLFIKGEQKFIWSKAFLTGFLLMLLIAVPWYALMVRLYHNAFTHEFFYNDHWRRLLEAEHRSNDRWYFYPASMFGCMFPWIFLAAAAFGQAAKAVVVKKADAFQMFLVIWIMVVLVVFQTAHSKLVSYIFPLFPAMALLSGAYLTERLNRLKRAGWLETATVSLCLLVPLIMLVAAKKYPLYLPGAAHAGAIIGVEVLFLLAVGVLFFQKKIKGGIFLAGLQVPLVLFLALTTSSNISPYISSQTAVEHLLKNRQVDGKIMASKFLIRGVKYFSGKDPVLVNFSDSNFFSPHPVPDLNTQEKLSSFLKSQPVSYGILNDHTWQALEAFCLKNGFHAELIEKVGNVYIVKVTTVLRLTNISGNTFSC